MMAWSGDFEKRGEERRGEERRGGTKNYALGDYNDCSFA
jgi:hypothetical protein